MHPSFRPESWPRVPGRSCISTQALTSETAIKAFSLRPKILHFIPSLVGPFCACPAYRRTLTSLTIGDGIVLSDSDNHLDIGPPNNK